MHDLLDLLDRLSAAASRVNLLARAVDGLDVDRADHDALAVAVDDLHRELVDIRAALAAMRDAETW